MTHLGERVSALVDGELDYRARERALAHLAMCAQCRQAVESERRAKRDLQTMPAPEPSAALLVALSHRVRGTYAVQEGAPLGFPAAPRRRTGAVRSTRNAGFVLAGAGSLSASVLAAAYFVGGPTEQSQPPPVAPPVGEFSAEFTGSHEPIPFGDPSLHSFTVSSSSQGTP